MTRNRNVLSGEAFAGLGDGEIAYIRPVDGGEARGLFPSLPDDIAPDLKLWALLSADGTPIMLADTREAVVMNAHDNNLEAVSLH